MLAKPRLHVRAALCCVLFFVGDLAAAATLPPGFSESQVAGGLTRPTAMAFAPDGRLFVCEQDGRLRIVKNGVLLATPFVSLTVNSAGNYMWWIVADQQIDGIKSGELADFAFTRIE